MSRQDTLIREQQQYADMCHVFAYWDPVQNVYVTHIKSGICVWVIKLLQRNSSFWYVWLCIITITLKTNPFWRIRMWTVQCRISSWLPLGCNLIAWILGILASHDAGQWNTCRYHSQWISFAWSRPLLFRSCVCVFRLRTSIAGCCSGDFVTYHSLSWISDVGHC